MRRHTVTRSPGFTIVELLVVIVVIGILAGLTMVTYRGFRERAVITTLKSDLTNAANAMEIARIEANGYPATLPPTAKASPSVTIEKIATSGAHYSDLDVVQNGTLFELVCKDLITQGYGRSTNTAQNRDAYITSCNVHNSTQLEIRGWYSKDVTAPFSEATLIGFATDAPAGDSSHVDQQATIRSFYAKLRQQFKASGGSFDVTSFWDSWATPGNGIVKPVLPADDSAEYSKNHYCIQATYADTASTTWQIRQGSQPSPGPC